MFTHCAYINKVRRLNEAKNFIDENLIILGCSEKNAQIRKVLLKSEVQKTVHINTLLVVIKKKKKQTVAKR